jgi:hypothetical protein
MEKLGCSDADNDPLAGNPLQRSEAEVSMARADVVSDLNSALLSKIAA